MLAKRSSRSSDSFLKQRSASMFYRVHNWIAQQKIPHDVGDFRLIDRQVIEALRSLPERRRFMKGLFAWVGFRTATVEQHGDQRIAGQSKFSGWRLLNFALEGITSFSTAPLEIWTYVGATISALSFLYGLLIIAKTLVFGIDVPGYASLLVSVLPRRHPVCSASASSVDTSIASMPRSSSARSTSCAAHMRDGLMELDAYRQMAATETSIAVLRAARHRRSGHPQPGPAGDADILEIGAGTVATSDAGAVRRCHRGEMNDLARQIAREKTGHDFLAGHLPDGMPVASQRFRPHLPVRRAGARCRRRSLAGTIRRMLKRAARSC